MEIATAANEEGKALPPAPKRGSAAKTQSRTARGRFTNGERRRAKPRRYFRGPARLALLDHLALVRRATVLEGWVGRLEAEHEGRRWVDPSFAPNKKMTGIERHRDTSVATNVAALKEVFLGLAKDGADPHYLLLETEMRKTLDGWALKAARQADPTATEAQIKLSRFNHRTLYREPYASMWRAAKIEYEVVQLDSPAAKRNQRVAKSSLKRKIMKFEKRFESLRSARRAALAAQSREEPGWTPIPIDSSKIRSS